MKDFRKAVNVSMFVVLVLLFGHSANAQGPVYHPGQTIRISVTFEGPDAERINLVYMNLSIPQTSVLASQPGFKYDIFPGESKPTGPKTFEVSYKVPDNQASGDYPLGEIRAVINREAPIELRYSPEEFPRRTFKIDNPNTLVKPKIKDVKELP